MWEGEKWEGDKWGGGKVGEGIMGNEKCVKRKGGKKKI